MFGRIFLSMVTAGFIGVAFVHRSKTADCGANIPCACGDNVVASRTLISRQENFRSYPKHSVYGRWPYLGCPRGHTRF